MADFAYERRADRPHHSWPVIAGNPKAGRILVKLAIVLQLAVTLVTIWVTSRKKSAPTNEPPLHPSTFVLLRPVSG